MTSRTAQAASDGTKWRQVRSGEAQLHGNQGVISNMQHDDEPLNAAATTPSGPEAVAAQGVTIDEHLFEDILDLEGALRLSTQATAGLGAPRATEIVMLGRKLPEPSAAKMQVLADEVRKATQAGDLARVRECHLHVIDTLVSLRTTCWAVKSEE
ncbi:hypothetical protein [Novosphingobium resinovorum]